MVAGLLGSAMAVSSFAGTIKYTDHDPSGKMRTDFVESVWLKDVEKETGMKVQSFFGAALLKSKEALGGVGSGVADVGFIFPGHYPERLMVHSVFSLFPTGPAKFENMTWLYREAYKQIPEFKAELAKENVTAVMITAGLPGAFAGKKTLNSLADIKGDRWRAGGKWLLRYLGNAGATPVSVPWGDVYMSLQTGVIDGVFTNYDGLHAMKFDEIASNLLISKELWYATPFLHIANNDFLAKLSASERKAFMNASMAAEAKFSGVYNKAFDQVRKEQEDAGYKVTVLKKKDLQMWADPAKIEVLRKEWIAAAEKKGLKNAAAVMQKVKELHAKAIAR